MYNRGMDVASSGLPPAVRYAPWGHGRYDVAPGLGRFAKDGGGAKVFELDQAFQTYRRAKLAARADDVSRYVCASELSEDVLADIAGFLVRRLAVEYPRLLCLRDGGEGTILRCELTAESLVFDAAMR